MSVEKRGKTKITQKVTGKRFSKRQETEVNIQLDDESTDNFELTEDSKYAFEMIKKSPRRQHFVEELNTYISWAKKTLENAGLETDEYVTKNDPEEVYSMMLTQFVIKKGFDVDSLEHLAAEFLTRYRECGRARGMVVSDSYELGKAAQLVKVYVIDSKIQSKKGKIGALTKREEKATRIDAVKDILKTLNGRTVAEQNNIIYQRMIANGMKVSKRTITSYRTEINKSK
jgi:hypothetical protein